MRAPLTDERLAEMRVLAENVHPLQGCHYEKDLAAYVLDLIAEVERLRSSPVESEAVRVERTARQRYEQTGNLVPWESVGVFVRAFWIAGARATAADIAAATSTITEGDPR